MEHTVAVVNPAGKGKGKKKGSKKAKRKGAPKKRRTAAQVAGAKKAAATRKRKKAARVAAGKKGARARKAKGKRRKSSKPKKRRRASPKATSSVGKRKATVSVRYANKPKKRRKSKAGKKRRKSNPKRARRKRNPGKLSIAKFKAGLPPLKGKWGLGDYLMMGPGGASEFLFGGLGIAATGHQAAAPVTGAIWWLGSSFALNKWRLTKGVAKGYFWGGAIGFSITVITTAAYYLTGQQKVATMQGLSMDELGQMSPMDAAKELIGGGAAHMDRAVKSMGLGKGPLDGLEDLMGDYSATPFATQLGWSTDVVGPGGGLAKVTERGWGRGDSSYADYYLKRVQALGNFHDEMGKWKQMIGLNKEEFTDGITGP